MVYFATPFLYLRNIEMEVMSMGEIFYELLARIIIETEGGKDEEKDDSVS